MAQPTKVDQLDLSRRILACDAEDATTDDLIAACAHSLTDIAESLRVIAGNTGGVR